MFVANSNRTGPIAVHPALRRAAALARAFILLEDPELAVAGEQRITGARRPDGVPTHPHRVPASSRRGARRPGAGVPRAQPCLCPVPARRAPRAGASVAR